MALCSKSPLARPGSLDSPLRALAGSIWAPCTLLGATIQVNRVNIASRTATVHIVYQFRRFPIPV